MDIHVVVDTDSLLTNKEKQLNVATGMAVISTAVVRFSNNYVIKSVAGCVGLMSCGFMTARLMDKYFG